MRLIAILRFNTKRLNLCFVALAFKDEGMLQGLAPLDRARGKPAESITKGHLVGELVYYTSTYHECFFF